MEGAPEAAGLTIGLMPKPAQASPGHHEELGAPLGSVPTTASSLCGGSRWSRSSAGIGGGCLVPDAGSATGWCTASTSHLSAPSPGTSAGWKERPLLSVDLFPE